MSDPSDELGTVEITIENLDDDRGNFSSPAVYTPNATATTITHTNTEDGYCPYTSCPFSAASPQTFEITWTVTDEDGAVTDTKSATDTAANDSASGGD